MARGCRVNKGECPVCSSWVEVRVEGGRFIICQHLEPGSRTGRECRGCGIEVTATHVRYPGDTLGQTAKPKRPRHQNAV